MTILNRLFASAGPEILHPTLEISDGIDSTYLTTGFNDLTVTLEDLSEVTFTAVGMDVAFPPRNADGLQDLRFALCNINGSVSAFIRDCISNEREMTATLRFYTSDDLSAPAEPPYEFTVISGTCTIMEAQIVARFYDIFNRGWPRLKYNLENHPGLRYFT